MRIPAGVQRDRPLARLTTVRTGGSADFFARPESGEQLAQLLAWSAESGIEVGVVGSGSNLLVADEGYRGLVVKLTAGSARSSGRARACFAAAAPACRRPPRAPRATDSPGSSSGSTSPARSGARSR